MARPFLESEDETVDMAMELVNSGRVVLTGNFAGQRLSDAPICH